MMARDRRSVWVMDSFLLTSILNKSTRNTRSLSKVNFTIYDYSNTFRNGSTVADRKV